MCSQAKLQANRLNAQKSTGPKTPQGKARSRLNSVTHAAYCQTLLLPGESEEDFQEVSQSLRDSIEPRDAIELMMFERMLSARWKLYRLAKTERVSRETSESQDWKDLMELKTLERLHKKRKSAFVDDAEIYYENVARQEQRLENQFHKALRELRQWRAAKAKEAKMKNEATEDAQFETRPAETPVSERSADRRSEDPDSSSETTEIPENVSFCPADVSISQNEPNIPTTEVQLLPPTAPVG